MVVVPNLITAMILTTRGTDMICKNPFLLTNINTRNSSPNYVVHAESTNIFKTKLDPKFKDWKPKCN